MLSFIKNRCYGFDSLGNLVYFIGKYRRVDRVYKSLISQFQMAAGMFTACTINEF